MSVPVRWCGIEGAPSMQNPGIVPNGWGGFEATTDDVLWRRHERASDRIYIPDVDLTFRSGATAAIASGPTSFPIIRDTFGTGGNVYSMGEASDAWHQCQRAWLVGDPLYYDQNLNNMVDAGIDTLLSTSTPVIGFVELGHGGAALHPVPATVKFVDLKGGTKGQFDIGERIYRDENSNGKVDAGDTLLTSTLGTVVGNINAADLGASLLSVPANVKYLDLIRDPPNTFNIGYPSVTGITAVSANDFNITGLHFPPHGVAGSICGGTALFDDPSQYLPAYPIFEPDLVAHEFGHALCLNHGEGVDENNNGQLDEAAENDPASPFAPGFTGTLCNANIVMEYCWRDDGAPANPLLVWVGVGAPVIGQLTFNLAGLDQKDVVRAHAQTIPDTQVDPMMLLQKSSRTDLIGDVPETFGFVDITDFSVTANQTAGTTTFSLTTRRPFPQSQLVTIDYFFLADLDDDPSTGGNASLFNIPTNFNGTDLIGRVTINTERSYPQTVSLYRYSNTTGNFTLISDPSIIGQWISNEQHADFAGYSERASETISISMSNNVRGPMTSTFRVDYVARDMQSKITDSAETPGMNFAAPIFGACTTQPAFTQRGGTVTVQARGLLPNRSADVFLGDRPVATTTIDSVGNATAKFSIPTDTQTGKHLVTIGAAAVTGDCFLQVGGAEVTFVGSGVWILLLSLAIVPLAVSAILFKRTQRRR